MDWVHRTETGLPVNPVMLARNALDPNRLVCSAAGGERGDAVDVLKGLSRGVWLDGFALEGGFLGVGEGVFRFE